MGAPNSLQTVYGVLSVRSVGRRACDMLLVDSTREVCNPSTATRLYGGHTETTACDRRTEHFPWVLLTGQQPGVLAGGGRAHSRLQCAGWFQTLQEEKKEKKQFETGHHEPRRLHTHRWEVADWMVFARRLGDLLFQTAAWLRCGSGALEMTWWHVHECGVDHAEPSTHSITNFRFSLPPSPPSTMLCPGSRPIFVSDVFRPPSPESTL